MASDVRAPRSWPLVVVAAEYEMAMWAPCSVGGAIEIRWSAQGYEIGFERRVTFQHGGNTVRVAASGGPNAIGVTRCRSSLEPWGDDQGLYHLVERGPLLWLVDDDVIARIDLPAREHTPATIALDGEGVRDHRDSLIGRLGASNLEQLTAAYESEGLAPRSIVSLDARTELAGALSVLTIARWPARWSLEYHWVGDPSHLAGYVISPLWGLVEASTPDGRAWWGMPGGGGSGSNGHSHGTLDFVGPLDDDVSVLHLEWPDRDGAPRLTIELTW